MAKTIMIVDDSVSLRQVVCIALRTAGFEVLEAGDGQEALGQLNGKKIHLIFSDVHMPRMDGISFVKAAKQIPAYRFTPVVMLTTESGDAAKCRGKEAGAKAWMTKPFQPAQIVSVVSKLIAP